MGKDSMTTSVQPSFGNKLCAALPADPASPYRLSEVGSFLDLLWDDNLTSEEVMALEPAVIVDDAFGPRRIIFQVVRNQIRYWLTSNRDPVALSGTAETELGSVTSLASATALCAEFLDAHTPISALRTARTAWASSK
jgi:hypothetical protein